MYKCNVTVHFCIYPWFWNPHCAETFYNFTLHVLLPCLLFSNMSTESTESTFFQYTLCTVSFCIQLVLFADIRAEHSLFSVCFLKMAPVPGNAYCVQHSCVQHFVYHTSRVKDFCHRIFILFSYVLLSSGGVGLCTQHRGPWNILYRLLRVSINFMRHFLK